MERSLSISYGDKVLLARFFRRLIQAGMEPSQVREEVEEVVRVVAREALVEAADRAECQAQADADAKAEPPCSRRQFSESLLALMGARENDK